MRWWPVTCSQARSEVTRTIELAAAPDAPVAGDDFRRALRRFAGACTVVTTCDGSGAPEGWAGLAATAVCSLSVEPPRLLVCVNRTVFAHRLIRETGVLAVNVLGRAHSDIAERFGGGRCASPQEKFALGEWRAGTTGAPILADALAAFDCKVAETLPGSTHDVFVCDVTAVFEHAHFVDPLIYFNGEFCGGLARLSQPARS